MQGRAYREGKVEVPKERGHKSIGSYEEDSAGALELPIFLRPRHFLVHALYNLDCAQQEGKPREPQGEEDAGEATVPEPVPAVGKVDEGEGLR